MTVVTTVCTCAARPPAVVPENADLSGMKGIMQLSMTGWTRSKGNFQEQAANNIQVRRQQGDRWWDDTQPVYVLLQLLLTTTPVNRFSVAD